MEETKIFRTDEIESVLIEKTIKEVIKILEERGYNAKNQLIGYLISGDPGYISNHKEARKRIMQFDRIKILEILVDNFIK